MKRKTAYKMAIEALIEKRRRHYAFDHNLALVFPATYNKNATKNFLRITKAIELLEFEMDHKQLDLFVEAE